MTVGINYFSSHNHDSLKRFKKFLHLIATFGASAHNFLLVCTKLFQTHGYCTKIFNNNNNKVTINTVHQLNSP